MTTSRLVVAENPIMRVPDGYKLVQTDDDAGVLGRSYTKAGAETLKGHFPPAHLGLRYEIEQITRNPFVFDRWKVVGYQNVLEKV